MDNLKSVTRIGIFGYESKDYGDILGKCELTLKNFTKLAVHQENVEVFYFCASRVNIAERTIRGTFYSIETDTFFEKQTTFPNSIYKEPARAADDILYLGKSANHIDRLKESDRVVHRYIQKIIPSTHVIMGNKTAIYRVMEKHCPKYLIETYNWEDKTIETHLDKHKVVILKPTASSGGRNIYKLSKNDKDMYVLQLDGTTEYYDRKSFFNLFSKKFNDNKYIVQPYILSMTEDGHPFDIRINVFRGRDGKLSSSHKEIFIRKGAQGNVASNVARGGDLIVEYEDFLKNEFGDQFQKIYDEIIDISENLLYEVQKGYPNFLLGSAGFDVGINRANGNELKIFEINRSPHIPTDVYLRNEVRYNYCLYLAENGQGLKKQQKAEYVPTKKGIAITFDRSDSIDCTFNGLPINNLVWEIVDTNIARIDEKNNITAVNKGETMVNAILDGVIVASVPVHVERSALPPLSDIKPSRFTLDNNGVYINKDENKANSNKATLMFVGDLMFLSEQQRYAKTQDGSYNFNPSFDYVKSLLKKADFSMGTLETIIDPTYPYKSEQTKVDDGTGYMVPNCNAPVTCLDAIRHSGLDAVSTANNHCLDGGIRGLMSTIDHLDRYNIIYTGTFKEKDRRYLLFDINGIKVAVLAYTTYLNLMESLWGLTPEEKSIYTNHYIMQGGVGNVTKRIIKKEIADARERGADFVVVMMHAGVVNTLDPVGKVVEVCNELANAGADYILGDHTHTLQKYNIIKTSDGRKVPVIYSMGNFVGSMDQVEEHRNRDAIILNIELERKEGKIIMNDSYIPCFSLRRYKGNRYVTMPCDKAYNGEYRSDALVEAKKRIKATLGGDISKLSSKKYEL